MWSDAHIEDLMFEEFNQTSDFVTEYKIPILEEIAKNDLYPSCCVYTFYSSSFGDGLGEYFELLSKDFSTLQFVITWLVPDLGYIGREHQINGEIVDQEVIERDKNTSNFRKFIKKSKLWFKDDFDEEYLIPN